MPSIGPISAIPLSGVVFYPPIVLGTFSVAESGDILAILGALAIGGKFVTTESGDIIALHGALASKGILNNWTESGDSFFGKGNVVATLVFSEGPGLLELSFSPSISIIEIAPVELDAISEVGINVLVSIREI